MNRRMIRTMLGGCTAALMLFGAGTARSQSLDRLSNQVESTNLAKATAAARALGRLRSPKALNLLMETLLLGARPELAEALVKAISDQANPQAFHLLAHYTNHRSDAVRAAAVEAMGKLISQKLKGRIFELAMRSLKDGSSSVRAEGAKLIAVLSADGLDSKSQERAEKLLLHLLLVRKDQRSARIALSVMGGVRTARFLAVHLKHLPERIVTTLCGAFLKRKDFGPEPVRVWVVLTLGKLTGPEAIAALMEYIRDSENRRRKALSVSLARSIAEK